MTKNKRALGVILYSLPFFIICSIYLIGFYPGFMSPDSFSQWGQIQTLKLDDWHPVVHTMFNYLITRVWNYPAAISIVQILMISLIVGYGFYTFEKIGVNKKLLLVIAIIFSLFPANEYMTISLWKDIPYSGMLLLLTIICINVVFSNGLWLEEKRNIVLLVVASIGVIFFRHNGILPFVCTMVLLFIFFKRFRKQTGILTVFLIITYILVKGPLYSAIGVIPAQQTEAFGIPMQQVGAVVTNGGSITSEQKDFIANILPIETWGKAYDRYSSNSLKFNKDFNGKFLVDNKVKFMKIWAQICMQNPYITFKAYTDQTSLVWRLTNSDVDFVYITDLSMSENAFGIKMVPISTRISSILSRLYWISHMPVFKWLFWKPALELYVTLILGAICSIKIGKKMLLIMIPMLANVGCFLLATPAQDYRYMYPVVLISILFIPLYMAVRSKNVYNLGEENMR